jgi:Sortase domain
MTRFRRPLITVGALALVVIAAAGLSVVLGGGLPGSGHATVPTTGASPTVGASSPTAGAATTPGANGSPAASLPPITGLGIRADRITIARLGIDLPIIDGDGIDAPIDKAAHFPETGWPDGGTNIYIYAHARAGLFLPLWGAVVGDRVDLTLVDGSTRSYVVDQVLPKVPFDAVEYLQPTATEQLTLQTSTAPDAGAPRFVVIAHPAP